MIVILLLALSAAIFFTALFISTKRTMDFIFCNSTISAWEARLLSAAKFAELADAPDLRSALLALEDSEYGAVVRNLPSQVDDFRLVERALHEHVVAKFQELASLVPSAAAPLVHKLLEQRFLWNLKMVVAAIHHKIPKENRIRELIPSPIHSSESLHLLASAESLDQFLEFLKGTDYASALREARKDYEQLGLPALVVALDKAYYRSLWSVAQKSKIDQRIIRPLIGYLIDAINVKTILRLKEVGASESEIDRYLVRPAHELSESMMRAMIAAEDLKSAIHAIRITTVGDVLLQATEAIAREGVIAAERALDEHYLGLCKQMELAHQFSVAPIISYIAHKESEFKKLRKCLRLKADKRPPEEIKKDLMAEVHAR